MQRCSGCSTCRRCGCAGTNFPGSIRRTVRRARAGISGIFAGILRPVRGETLWKGCFLAGLVAGGLLLRLLLPQAFAFGLVRSPAALMAAGLLVGYGTRLGNGCTSGHGVCGVSRLSRRSIAATAVFLATGALTVFVINHLFGGSL